METVYILQFEQQFQLYYHDLINIEDLGADSYDDGIYHFIHLLSQDVYSFDTFDNIWLEKNEHQTEIRKRLSLSH